jgi:hypothetical protein
MKLAIIIKGNANIISLPRWRSKANKFYSEIEEILIKRGYSVEFDPGLDFTKPKEADLYVAHSRGMSRLQYTDPNVPRIYVDDFLPKDHLDLYGKPQDAHFIVSDSLRAELERC